MAKERCKTCGAKVSLFPLPTTSGELKCCQYCEEIIRSSARDVGQGDYKFEFDLRAFKKTGVSLFVYFSLARAAAEST